MPEMPADEPGRTWWRDGVLYQIYPRSYMDTNGDGVGDLRGITERLDHLAWLGVEGIWLDPVMPSPNDDWGYDVADYVNVDAALGTLADADKLITEATKRGIRVIMDLVPNHTSDRHPWFLDSKSSRTAKHRDWYVWADPKPDGSPPNNWNMAFDPRVPAWTFDEHTGQYYLNQFLPSQPDLNWWNPEVRDAFDDILRFWFDRGVAGIRIDSAALPVKDPTLPELPEQAEPGQHPHIDRDELHDIYRGWRAVADSYRERVLVGEIWLDDNERFARYLREDELHSAFNFDFMGRPWEAKELRGSIEDTLTAHAPVGAPPTWVLSNHDVTRPVTRYGRVDSSFSFTAKRFGTPTDLELGTRRARAASLIAAALPGCLYIYQGDELGLPEVEDIPLDRLQDPMHFRSEGVDPGRDGCRVPLPWTADGPSAGFSPDSAQAEPWLPQPQGWGRHSVEAQVADQRSMLHLYRQTLAVRRQQADLGEGALTWLDLGDGVLAFTRGDSFASITNFTAEPVRLPAGSTVLLASGDLPQSASDQNDAHDCLLPPDTTAWLRLAAQHA
jgi:alpha-glucosidase